MGKSKAALQDELDNLKADYVRIQSDMDKLEYVRGRVSSAEDQLIRLEKEIAHIYKQLEAFD
ncbi:SE1832 family protein [Virgibacillus sp. LDC-1]|uniref:SE1832 family protein n=1 Tax=Virgibacillus sp. LDC-1 TaxID=3039856 RepID=UPI0024DEBB9C|nr:SE1832 family protein [Virgibacillus sp. LDC-1]